MQIAGASTELGFETGMTRSIGVGIGIGDQLLYLMPSCAEEAEFVDLSGVQG